MRVKLSEEEFVNILLNEVDDEDIPHLIEKIDLAYGDIGVTTKIIKNLLDSLSVEFEGLELEQEWKNAVANISYLMDNLED